MIVPSPTSSSPYLPQYHNEFGLNSPSACSASLSESADETGCLDQESVSTARPELNSEVLNTLIDRILNTKNPNATIRNTLRAQNRSVSGSGSSSLEGSEMAAAENESELELEETAEGSSINGSENPPLEGNAIGLEEREVSLWNNWTKTLVLVIAAVAAYALGIHTQNPLAGVLFSLSLLLIYAISCMILYVSIGLALDSLGRLPSGTDNVRKFLNNLRIDADPLSIMKEDEITDYELAGIELFQMIFQDIPEGDEREAFIEELRRSEFDGLKRRAIAYLLSDDDVDTPQFAANTAGLIDPLYTQFQALEEGQRQAIVFILNEWQEETPLIDSIEPEALVLRQAFRLAKQLGKIDEETPTHSTSFLLSLAQALRRLE